MHYAEAFDPETEFPDNPLYQWVLLPGTNQGSWQIVGYTRHWNHAGGLQVMGRFVVVPLEHIDNDSTAGFRIADLSDPVSPTWGAVHSKQRVALPDAGAAALTRLNDAKYMVMVFGKDSDNVEVFVSSQASMPEFGLPSSTWESKACSNTPSNFGVIRASNLLPSVMAPSTSSAHTTPAMKTGPICGESPSPMRQIPRRPRSTCLCSPTSAMPTSSAAVYTPAGNTTVTSELALAPM